MSSLAIKLKFETSCIYDYTYHSFIKTLIDFQVVNTNLVSTKNKSSATKYQSLQRALISPAPDHVKNFPSSQPRILNLELYHCFNNKFAILLKVPKCRIVTTVGPFNRLLKKNKT